MNQLEGKIAAGLLGLIIVATLLVMLSPGNANSGTTDTKPHVFILIVDELSASTIMNQQGTIDRRRFPNIARLARGATWYRNHTTTADVTKSAVPSILNGQMPGEGSNVQFNRDHDIFHLLKADYQIKAYEPISRLCSSCALPNPIYYFAGATIYPYRPWQKNFSYSAGAIDSIGPSKKPLLSINHLIMPHAPWAFLPNGRQYDRNQLDHPGLLRDKSWGSQQYPITLSQQRTIIQAQFVDRIVGRWQRQIKQAGMWDNSLMILVADHGADFTPRKLRRSVNQDSFSQLANVPMIVKYPDQRKAVASNQNTTHLNILPTINALTIDKPAYRSLTLATAPSKGQAQMRSAQQRRYVAQSTTDMVFDRRRQIADRDRRVSRLSPFLPTFANRYYGKKISLKAKVANAWLRVDNRQAFNRINLKQPTLNTIYLTASSKGLPLASRVLLTINGRAAAAGEVFRRPSNNYDREPAADKLAMMIHPINLRSGSAKLRFYLIGDDGLKEIGLR